MALLDIFLRSRDFASIEDDDDMPINWTLSVERGRALSWIEQRRRMERLPLAVRSFYKILDIEMIFGMLCRHNGFSLTSIAQLTTSLELVPENNTEARQYGTHRLTIVTHITDVEASDSVAAPGGNRLRTLETAKFYVIFSPYRRYTAGETEDPPVFSSSRGNGPMTLLAPHFSVFVLDLMRLGIREAQSGMASLSNAIGGHDAVVHSIRFHNAMRLVLGGGRHEVWEQLEEELLEELARNPISGEMVGGDVDAAKKDTKLKPIDLRSVTTLTFRNGQMSTSRKGKPVPQIACVGGDACSEFVPEVIQCTNVGFDGRDVQWRCQAELEDGLRLGTTDVACEGWSGPDDEKIVSGSCGVECEQKQSRD
ncbi:Store-operated calcium entry-associated regulatory factor [Gonapodya sp. JEL0774]|nr:Store-operated calcium entry-associated regulatory factor [Gonapodya sp. JEL0774]